MMESTMSLSQNATSAMANGHKKDNVKDNATANAAAKESMHA